MTSRYASSANINTAFHGKILHVLSTVVHRLRTSPEFSPISNHVEFI